MEVADEGEGQEERTFPFTNDEGSPRLCGYLAHKVRP